MPTSTILLILICQSSRYVKGLILLTFIITFFNVPNNHISFHKTHFLSIVTYKKTAQEKRAGKKWLISTIITITLLSSSIALYIKIKKASSTTPIIKGLTFFHLPVYYNN